MNIAIGASQVSLGRLLMGGYSEQQARFVPGEGLLSLQRGEAGELRDKSV